MEKEILLKGDDFDKALIEAGFYRKEPDRAAAANFLKCSVSTIANWKHKGLKDLNVVMTLKNQAKSNRKKKAA